MTPLREFCEAVPDCFFAQEAIASWRDPMPLFRYLRNALLTPRE